MNPMRQKAIYSVSVPGNELRTSGAIEVLLDGLGVLSQPNEVALRRIGASLDGLTGFGWGGVLIEALRTPGAVRGRLGWFVGDVYSTCTAKPDGRCISSLPNTTPGKVADHGAISLWGRSPSAEVGNVLEFINANRMAAGLAPLAGWRLVASGVDNPAIDWGNLNPPPPFWWIIGKSYD
jgi:hypothetical protein